jgi:protein-S-isoprenylcysteine O-methyltransferase Ste14
VKGFRFDPFGWFEAIVPPPWSHRVLRLAVMAVLVVFLVHRITQYAIYRFKPLWVVETLIYVVFIVSYGVRIDPVDRARGFKEVVVPLVGAMLPFALLATPPSPFIAGSTLRLTLVFAWMTASTALTVWGLWSLRRAFSITVEARGLVTRGPYCWFRHPVYLGEMLTAFAVAAWRASVANVVIFLVFVVVQLCRSRFEEMKLGRVVPGYAAYARRTFWFW